MRPRIRNIAGIVAIALMCLPATAQKKSKNAKAEPTAPARINIDTSNLVWPQPPELARIRYLGMYTGEKYDPAILEKPKNQKKNWKDVLAGAQSQTEKNVKIPLQFIRVYGVAADSKGLIYAADQAVGAVFIIDPTTKEAQLIRNGTEARFGLINGLAMDDNDRLFVSDSKFRHVLVFNAQTSSRKPRGGGRSWPIRAG